MHNRRLLRLAMLGLVLALWQTSDHAIAQQGENAPQRPERESRIAERLTSEKIKKLSEAYTAGRRDETRRRGSELLLSRLGPYERGQVQRLLATLELDEQRYASAREHLERAVESEGLNEQELDIVRYQIAQSWMGEELWQQGIDAWKRWAESAFSPPGAQAYYMLAVAYYRLHDLANALEAARRSVELSVEPTAAGLKLLVALRIEREEWAEAAPLLKMLIGLSPSTKSYWVQLAAVDSQLGNSAEATASMMLAYHAGLLTEAKDLRTLGALLLQAGVPHRAARIVSMAIESRTIEVDGDVYGLLASCWIQAGDYARAIDPLTSAAQLSEDGELYVRLAEVHAQSESWSDVATSIRRALEKGMLRSPGTAQLMLGIALYNQGRRDEARPAFERARIHADSRILAESWLRQLDREQS